MRITMKKLLVLILVAFLAGVFSISADEPGKYGVGTSDQFHGPVGLQMYSLRSYYAEDPEKAFRTASEYGFVEVEYSAIRGLSPEDYVAFLKKYNLRAFSGHWPFEQLENNTDGVIAEAKTLGLDSVGVAWLPHTGKFTEDDCRRAAEVFNRAAPKLHENGLDLYLHNHGYEFEPYEHGTLLDLFMSLTECSGVKLQLDILWTIFPGQDPVSIMKEYPTRIHSLHLKDLKKGVAGNLSGGTNVENDVALGTGQADYPAILKTAQEIGVPHFYIEDESPFFETQIRESLNNLEEKIKW